MEEDYFVFQSQSRHLQEKKQTTSDKILRKNEIYLFGIWKNTAVFVIPRMIFKTDGGTGKGLIPVFRNTFFISKYCIKNYEVWH